MNPLLPAAEIGQLVFARLDRHQSPRRREGFQTAYTTPGYLAADDLEMIEERLAFFPSPERRRKQVFFAAPSGLIVVARIVATDDRDASGRGGCYLAHALLIRPDVFHAADANPFVFLDQVPFLENLADALAAGDKTTGAIPPLVWRPTDRPSPDELIELTAEARVASARFSFRRPNQPGNRQRANPPHDADPVDRIVLTGPEHEIAATLRAVWPLVPAAWRPQASFDTDFEGCNSASTQFWVTGQRNASKAGPLPGRAAVTDQPTPYAAWVRWRLNESSVAWTKTVRDTAARYCQTLEDPQTTIPDTDQAVIGEVVAANRPWIRTLLMRGLRDTLWNQWIPSPRHRWHWRLRALLRRFTPHVLLALIDFLTGRSSRGSWDKTHPGYLDPPAEFAGDVLAPLWTCIVDELLASEPPATLYSRACGQNTHGSAGRRPPGAGGRSISRLWSVEQVTASIRAVARHRGFPHQREIRETLASWLGCFGDPWLIVWYCGWSQGVAGVWLVGVWRRFRLRKLMAALPLSDQRELVDALWRQEALGGGRLLEPDEASDLRDRLLKAVFAKHSPK